MHGTWKTVAAVLLGSMLVPRVFAQGTGRLSGSVVDASGGGIPQAAVRLYLAGGQEPVLGPSANGEGLFYLIGIRPAPYDLEIEKAGFGKQKLTSLRIDAGRETAVPAIRLEVGRIERVMEVGDSQLEVKTANAEVSSTLTAEQLRRLPVLDRNVLALITT
jgi:Carboxypeptidase regulatory-like domain